MPHAMRGPVNPLKNLNRERYAREALTTCDAQIGEYAIPTRICRRLPNAAATSFEALCP